MIPSIDIGELPSTNMNYTFNRIMVREILLSDIPVLEMMQKLKKVRYVINFLTNVTSLTEDQAWSLTEGDTVYILSYIKKLSFTDIPIPLTWTCNNHVISKIGLRLAFMPDDGQTDAEIAALGYERRICSLKNAELIYPYSVKTNIVQPTIGDKDIQTTKTLFHLPTLRDLHIEQEMRDESYWPKYAALSERMLWIAGTDAQQKLNVLHGNFETILSEDIDSIKCKAHNHIMLSYNIRCAECDYRGVVSKQVDMYSALHQIDSVTVMNKQYNLMKIFGVLPPEETPLRKILFWLSAYKKDQVDQYGADKKKRKRVK